MLRQILIPALSLVCVWYLSLVAWGVFVPLCITGQKIKTVITGQIYENKSYQTVFESDRLVAFLDDDVKVGFSSNTLVFGTCESSLINILRGKISLKRAVIGDTQDGFVKYPERKDVFDRVRGELAHVIARSHSGVSAGILQGLVLGDKMGLSFEFRQLLIDTGTIHILVASGFNVILVGSLLVIIFTPLFGRLQAHIVSLVGVFLYACLTGFDPPVVRAFLMYTVVCGGVLLGRKVRARDSLWWAVAIIVVADPWTVFDAGFQLSVAATYGLVSLKPTIDRYIYQRLTKQFLWLQESEFTTVVSAMIATTPVLFWHFGRVSLVALFTNMLIGPIVPVLTVLGFLELILLVLGIPLGGMVSVGTEVLSQLIIKILETF